MNDNYEDIIDNLQAKCDALEADNSELLVRIEELEKENRRIEELEAELSDTKDSLEEAVIEADGYEYELLEARGEIEDYEMDLSARNDEIAELYEIVPSQLVAENNKIKEELMQKELELTKALFDEKEYLEFDTNFIERAIRFKVSEEKVDHALEVLESLLKKGLKKFENEEVGSAPLDGEFSHKYWEYSGGGATTLSPENGYLDNGWYICAGISEDYYQWINRFIAFHPNYGMVSGDYEDDHMYATNEETLIKFLEDNPCEHWDYMDI